MIDIHNHILPQIDDGAADLEEAIEMARIAGHDGIRHIIATPHLPASGMTLAEIEKKTTYLNVCLQQAGINVMVYPGAEIPVYMLDNENFRIGLAGSRYLLVEFSLYGMLPGSVEIFNYLTGLGYKIIIAHPERNSGVLKNPAPLLNLLTPDVTLQITADSLTGKMGKEIMSMARYLLKKGVVTYLATDAHGIETRRPELSSGLKAAEKYLKKEALNLVDNHPRKILSSC